MKKIYRQSQRDKPITNELSRFLSQNIPDWYGKGATLTDNQPQVIINKSSFIILYKIKFNDSRKSIVVKIRREANQLFLSDTSNNETTSKSSLQEYLSLLKVYQAQKKLPSGLIAVRPLAYINIYNAIVMERVLSSSLHNLLIQGGNLYSKKRVKDINDASNKVGEWLFSYHQSLNVPENRNVDELIKAEIENYTSKIDVNIRKYGKDIQKIIETFNEKIRSLTPIIVPYSNIHGDMSCENILYTNNKEVCLIDIQDKFDSIYSDLCLILIHPHTLKIQIFSFGYFYPKIILKNYRQSILNGYFKNIKIDKDIVNIYCALMVLKKWARFEYNRSNYRGIKQFISTLFLPITNRYFFGLITSYLNSKTVANC